MSCLDILLRNLEVDAFVEWMAMILIPRQVSFVSVMKHLEVWKIILFSMFYSSFDNVRNRTSNRVTQIGNLFTTLLLGSQTRYTKYQQGLIQTGTL